MGPLLGRLGVRQAGAAAGRVAAELDAASVVARMEAAVGVVGCACGPLRTGWRTCSVLGPLKDVVGAYAARAGPIAGGGGWCSAPRSCRWVVGWVRSRRTLRWRCCPGAAVGQLQPVEVHLVMTDRALLGTGDPRRSVFEPARIPGHGSVPALVARAWLREGLDPREKGHRRTTSAAGTRRQRWRASPHRAVWLRRFYTGADGRDLVAMDSRRRVFGGLLRRMLVLRDDVCTTPWCEAPIVHADHTTPDPRRTVAPRFHDGDGKCARCNQTKEAPGWRHRVTVREAQRVVEVRSPLGHHYVSEPPPLLGSAATTRRPPYAPDGFDDRRESGTPNPRWLHASGRPRPPPQATAVSTKNRAERTRQPARTTTPADESPRTRTVPLPHVTRVRAVPRRSRWSDCLNPVPAPWPPRPRHEVRGKHGRRMRTVDRTGSSTKWSTKGPRTANACTATGVHAPAWRPW